MPFQQSSKPWAPDRLQYSSFAPLTSKGFAVMFLLMLEEIVLPLFSGYGKEALRADQIPGTFFIIVSVNERRKELVVHTWPLLFGIFRCKLCPPGFCFYMVKSQLF